MNDKTYFLASTAVSLVSASLIIGAVKRKPQKRTSRASLVLAGLTGAACAMALAYQPERRARKKLTLRDDLLDAREAAYLERHIAEVLGQSSKESE